MARPLPLTCVHLDRGQFGHPLQTVAGNGGLGDQRNLTRLFACAASSPRKTVNEAKRPCRLRGPRV